MAKLCVIHHSDFLFTSTREVGCSIFGLLTVGCMFFPSPEIFLNSYVISWNVTKCIMFAARISWFTQEYNVMTFWCGIKHLVCCRRVPEWNKLWDEPFSWIQENCCIVFTSLLLCWNLKKHSVPSVLDESKVKMSGTVRQKIYQTYISS